MSEEYGNDYITLTDEDGNEIELEHLDTVEYNNQTYMAFLPANAALDESYDLIIMKIELEENEILYAIKRNSTDLILIGQQNPILQKGDILIFSKLVD